MYKTTNSTVETKPPITICTESNPSALLECPLPVTTVGNSVIVGSLETSEIGISGLAFLQNEAVTKPGP
jgi:hypothetical protein